MILHAFEINDDQVDEIVVSALKRTRKLIEDNIETGEFLVGDEKKLRKACKRLIAYYSLGDQ